MAIKIRPDVKAIREEIISLRRWFHQHPELGFEETETANRVAQFLKEWGLKITTGLGKTGLVGLLDGDASGPCVALRADMDGLPIRETGDVSFKSTNDGVMHACGHDGHMAMLLGAARILSGMKERLRGTVKFIFQPAEEGGAGARFLIDEGVLKDPDVAEIYGIHLWNYQDFGTVGIKDGFILAAADKFRIEIEGRGGHGAAPQGTVDAVVVASHLIQSLQTIVSRNTNPLESTVVTVGRIHGGHNFNVIADRVELEGTARAYAEDNRQMIIRRMKEIVDGVGATYGADINLDYQDGYPPTVNSEKETRKVSEAARKIVGEGVQYPYLSMGGEDFSYYLQTIPGCFFFVGSAHGEAEPMSVPHHTSHFNFHEDALLMGTSIWVQLVEDLLVEEK